MICSNCGTNNADGTRFCVTCGSRLDVPPVQQQPVYNQNHQQGGYTPPPPPVYSSAPQQDKLATPLSVGDYMIMMLIMAIPLVGFIMLFVWAFGGSVNVNKSNFAKASLIWMLIGIGVSIIISIIAAIAGASLFSALNGMY